MGNEGSKTQSVTNETMRRISGKTHFTVEEVQKLYQSFLRVSGDQKEDGKIDLNEFSLVLGIPSVGFSARVFSAFDTNPNKSLDFEEYCCGLSAISTRASIEEKAKFCFNVYDIDKNGTISRDELKEVLEESLNANLAVQLTPQQLERIITNTVKEMDKNGDGSISYEEFLAQAQKNPAILSCVKVDLANLLQ